MKSDPKPDEILAVTIPWNELFQILQKENIKELAKRIDISTLAFAAKETNLEVIIDSAWKSLKNTDPENASYERAVLLAEKMQEFAEKILRQTKLRER